MHTITVGKTAIAAAGLGCMAFSGGYGKADYAESIATIHAALDAGLSLLDTGDFYGSGHNEMLLGAALKGGKREQAFLSVKFGALRSPDGAYVGYDARPAAVKNFLGYSLRRLQTDYVDLYQPARYDHSVPLEDTLGAIADLVKAGYVRNIGLSEVGAATLKRSAALHPAAALQIEYSMVSRGIEEAILPTARALGIPVVVYGVLSRGLLSAATLGGGAFAGEIRARMPRFDAGNLARNRALVAALDAIAKARGVSIPQLAFAWVRSRGADIVPLIGARNRAQLADGLAGLGLTLSADDLAAIEAAVPKGAAAGERYNAMAMQHLDSEQS